MKKMTRRGLLGAAVAVVAAPKLAPATPEQIVVQLTVDGEAIAQEMVKHMAICFGGTEKEFVFADDIEVVVR